MKPGKQFVSLALFLALASGVPSAQSRGWLSRVRALAREKNVADAQRLVEAARPAGGAVTSEWLAGVSWLARGASFAGQWDVAEKYASEAFAGSQQLLQTTSVDADENLETALGAAIEVLAGVYNAGGNRGQALEFLRQQIARYRGTRVEMRIQKNVLLYTLEGKPMPALRTAQYLRGGPRGAEAIRGKVTLFFFWAHWCADCKRQKPILEALYQRYAPRGFAVVGPTRLFGYILRGEDATPQQELEYLRGAFQQQNPIPEWMEVPISEEIYLSFGVSTTPTLVLVDRDGIVRLYHPGRLSYEELAAMIEKLLV